VGATGVSLHNFDRSPSSKAELRIVCEYSRLMAGVVLGRDSEQQRLSRFLESLKEGPAACVLEGEAGIGKTELWRGGVETAQAASFRVLRCAPAEVEATLSYSALADLLAGVEPEILAGLPEPQRDALEIALLRAGPGDAAVSQRAIATATVSALGALAASSPLLVAVDDVQWLDRPSARVLEFAARRLGSHPIGFLVSMRTPAEAARAHPCFRAERGRLASADQGKARWHVQPGRAPAPPRRDGW
jgi:hypothetical protein